MNLSEETPKKALRHTPKDFSSTEDRGAAPFPIAGIGASAGGLEALRTFLENLPDDTGIAYVIVQHLSPDHESILPELLNKKTSMPVHKVEDRMAINSNNIYVIPPNTYMSIIDGHLTLSPRVNKTGAFLPIDFFFKNLASIYQNKAIGILLSGTGSDGTIGFKDIKAEGGITFAQDDSADFSGMPKSAIDAGFVDFILSPDRIAKELNDILKQPYTALPSINIPPENETELRRVLIILHNKKGVDFSLYKQTTINRRILRRMALNRKKNLEEYAQILREDDAEVNQLYQDLLINVTTFFRDDTIFQALKKKILPDLFKDRKTTDPVRIWISACATGEEACSFAITVFEFLSKKALNTPFQIFATDLNAAAIEKARSGTYHSGTMENVSDERLKKFFVKIDGHYQVIKSIRDVCVFATHNLLTDPPFSRMDIVSCQNVMIYFETNAQKKILKAFHYALKPTGFLLLGKSETVGNSTDLFAQRDKDLKAYTKKDGGNHFDYDFSFPALPSFSQTTSEVDKLNKERGKETDIEKETDKLLLSRYVPASVVVNNDLQILRFHGPTSRYLQPSFGKASLNLLKMVREDLVFELRALIHKAKKSGISSKKEDIQLVRNGVSDIVDLEVVPIGSFSNDPYFLILFKETAGPAFVPAKRNNGPVTPDVKDQRIITLENDLREARESIRTMSEEFEATREELQSANEEVLSSNEELQSINEELETSKEELQSTNEELSTINEELHHRNDDLKDAFEYREAVVETIREPLIVLNTDLRVKTANRAFYENFLQKQNETEGFFLFEMGNGQWNIPGLRERLEEILSKDKSFQNFEVNHTFKGSDERVILFSAMRMVFEEKRKDRILLVIEDITLRRKAEDNLKDLLKTNTSILNSISDIFISVDNNWNITFINRQAKEFIGKNEEVFVRKNLWEIFSSYMDTLFHKSLISAMKTKTFAQFEFYDERMEEWYHFRLYPSQEALSIYANRITEQKLSESFIKQTKERYEAFITKTTEGIWRFEFKEPVSISLPQKKQIEEIYKNAYVAESNDAMAKMHGYENAAEMMGISLEDLFAKNETNESSLMRFIELGYRLADVETFEIKNEESMYFLNNLAGIIDHGHIVRIWGTQRNITEQKITERALTKTRNQLDFSLAAGSVGTFTWNFKTNKIAWTKVQESLYGIKEASFNGEVEEWFQFVYPDDVSFIKQAVDESLKNKKELSVEFRITWPDQSIHWILCRANILYDNKGKAIEMSGINIDISERKFKEQLIKENEERFRALVQNSFDVITVFNYDGTITYQSDSISRVLGYAVEERLGANIFDQSLVHPDDREIERKLFQRCIEKPYTFFRDEFRMLHKNGVYRIMEVGCINLANNSSIKGIIKNYRDITERRMIEKQKEEFIGIASHELKTPVTSIKAYTQILQETLEEKQDYISAGLLQKMDHQIDRLTNLIKDLLDVTKISEGKLDLKNEPYDMNELIEEVIEDIQSTTRKHTIVKELQPLKPIVGDKEKVSQVLVNLLSNAIKYSPEADKIIVRTAVTEDGISVCVQDFGIGISPEMQKSLFQRFFRVPDESTSTFPGLGLGLFISKEIIRRQNGRIWVESAPKKGSSFCFSLPFE